MNILIIAQHIFPMQTPRAHRATELVKEFSRLGHNVVVYTALGKYNYSEIEKQYNVTIKNIPIKFQLNPYNSDGFNKRTFIDKILGRIFGKVFQFPNIEFLFSISKIFKNKNKFDLLISIADPHHIHWGCARARIKCFENFPKKWIADCGDPFMENDKTKVHYKFYAKFEKQFCQLCDYITVPIPQAIDAYYPQFKNKIKVIPQGFKFKILNNKVEKPKNVIPTFAFAGIFYKDIRNPKLFLDYLCNEKKDFKFIVYTKYYELLDPYKSKLSNKLIIKEPINRNELLIELGEMDFLLNIENENSPSQLPSKLIDYAIVGKPILSINNLNFKPNVIQQFFDGNYTNQFIVKNVEQYNIKNVAAQFIELACK